MTVKMAVNARAKKPRGGFIQNRKNLIGLLLAVASALVALILSVISGHMGKALTEQGMASRWSSKKDVAQISCFFSADAGVDVNSIQEFEHGLDAYLTENSIEQTSPNPGARLWVDAYSGEGKITLTNGSASVEADALGVGGDFFLFHPQELLYGNYFSGNDLNSDYCVIDQDAAWKLFGSNNVAGMTVNISGVPHIVSGVIRRQEGRLLEAAGLDTTRVYVSYTTLERYGSSHGINHYEIVMPDPVKQFAYKYVREKMGSDEKESEVLENSTRFSLLGRLRLIKEFGTRSMNGKAIVYPYWENLARGYEDIIGVLTLWMILFLIWPVVYAILLLRYWWRHKGWTFKDIWLKIGEVIERFREKRYYHRQQAIQVPDQKDKEREL